MKLCLPIICFLFTTMSIASTERISVSIQSLLDLKPKKSSALLKKAESLKNVDLHWSSFNTKGSSFEVCSQFVMNILVPNDVYPYHRSYRGELNCTDVVIVKPKKVVNAEFENLQRPTYEIKEVMGEMKIPKGKKTIVYIAHFYQLVEIQTGKVIAESEYAKYRQGVCRENGCQYQQLQILDWGTSRTDDIMKLLSVLDTKNDG